MQHGAKQSIPVTDNFGCIFNVSRDKSDILKSKCNDCHIFPYTLRKKKVGLCTTK